MPNGQEEQQLTEEPLRQVETPTMSLGQAVGQMTDVQLMDLNHRMIVNQKKKQITSNVGAYRAAYYLEEIENNRMSLNEAVKQSKEALTPTMLNLNKQRFQEGMTSSDYNKLWKTTGELNWSTTEFDLWLKNLQALASAERSDLVRKGKISNLVAENKNHEEKARVYFNSLEHYIKNALSGGYDIATGKRIPRKKIPIVEKAWSALMAEFQKDMGYDENDKFNKDLYNTGDQKEMFEQLWLLVHNIPEDQLKRARFYYFPDDPEPLGEGYVGMSAGDQREVLFGKLKQLIMKAKLQLANIQEIEEDEPEGVESGSFW
jgi:hypothetical protein